MNPYLLQLLMGQQGVPSLNTTAMDLPPQYQPGAGQVAEAPVTPAAPATDPREALMNTLFANPPEVMSDPRWNQMGTAGKVGLVLSALADIQNARQRRSARGARTFAPSNYTGQFIEGQRQRGREKAASAIQAQQIKRAEAAKRLDMLDREAERKQREADMAVEKADREAIRAETRKFRMEDREDRQKEAAAAREDAQKFREEQRQASERDRAERARDRAIQDAKLDEVERRQINKERRDTVRDLKGAVNDAAAAIERGYAIGPQGQQVPAMSVEDSRRAIHRLINQYFHPSDPEAESVREYFEQEIGSRPAPAPPPPPQEPIGASVMRPFTPILRPMMGK